MQLLQYHRDHRVVRIKTLIPFVWHTTDAPNLDVGNMVLVDDSIYRIERIQPERLNDEDEHPLMWTFLATKVAEVAATLSSDQ